MIGRTLGHYNIVEKIGAGGMGEVYRAHDEHLDRDVAIKVLPVGTLNDKGARKRFRKEAQVLSKLSHPNIAMVFDFDSQYGIDFLAMELIPGVTLSTKLAAGPLDEAEVFKLATQLADGLMAAHARGIIHRDLKPGNLIVSPEGRLKILDFGLATLLKPTDEMDPNRIVTETQVFSGTLPYMAPEQFRGEPADARSDIYAAGTILYEMATGQRPFSQTQGAELIGAILHQTPSLPSTCNRTITPAFEGVVMKALNKTPAQRYQTARELLASLEVASGVAHQTGPTQHGTIGWLSSRWAFASLGVLLAAGVIGGLIFGLNVGGLRDRLLRETIASRPGFLPLPIKTRRSVAVLAFKNLSGRPDELWLSTALGEMLTTELAAGEQLRVISGENVAQMKVNLSLADQDTYGKETLNRIRKNLGTDSVVVGSYLALGNGELRVDLRLQDASSGEELASIAEVGSEAEVSGLVVRIGEKVREKLGAGSVTTTDAGAVRASLPSNLEAARLYSEGLAKLRAFDNRAALNFLQKAVAADSNFALSHSALAAAWKGLGYDAKAQQEAKKAYDLSANLDREDRLSIEARYRETTSEWPKAIEIYQTLFNFFPDNLDYGLLLADAQSSASKYDDALAVLQTLRKLPPPARDDPRIDLTEARAAYFVSDFKREQVAAERAAEKGTASGARLIVALAKKYEAFAFDNLGETEAALAAYADARRLFQEAGNETEVGAVIGDTGLLYFNRGDYPQAVKLYEQALAIHRGLGNKEREANWLMDLAGARDNLGQADKAQKGYEEALKIWREIGNPSGEADTLSNVANLLVQRGDYAGAKANYNAALAIFREIGDKAAASITLSNLGALLRLQGNLPEALSALKKSLVIAGQIGSKRISAIALNLNGELLADQDDLAGARKSYSEALAIATAEGDKRNAADARQLLADLSIDEGHADEAEPLARQAEEEFRSEKDLGGQLEAIDVSARSFLARGKLADAKTLLQRSDALAKTGQVASVNRIMMAITAAQFQAASNSAAAQKSVEASVAEATRMGCVACQLDARLTLGQIQMKSGNPQTGRATLSALEEDATAKGFLLIARKSHAADYR